MNNILEHPILAHQKKEASIVKKYGKELIQKIRKERSDLEEFIIIDIIIKLFRESICSALDCKYCKMCSPTNLMNEKEFLSFISQQTEKVIKKVKDWYNNSFNSPYRWFFIQNIIDEIIPDDENIVYIEIWCWAGLIWKVLTNSNYSKKIFPHIFRQTKMNHRNSFYLWIDPNLILGTKNKIMLVNWDTPEMHYTRSLIRTIEKDKNFTENDINYLKWFLNKESLNTICSLITKSN